MTVAHIDKITHTLAAIAAALLPLGASSESLASVNKYGRTST